MQRFIRPQRPDMLDPSLLDTVEVNRLDVSLLDTTKIDAMRPSQRFKRPSLMDIILVLLPLFAMFLWFISLQHVSVKDMNDLGLVSVLSPRIIISLGILVVSFVFVLQQRELKPLLLALHIIFIILIIDGTQNLIEEMPRFSIVYEHAGYTEYIMRTGTVDPNLNAYFNWPIFFVLSAFVTKVFGYSTVLSYAGWAPVFFSLIYFGPLYMILSSITNNKRIVWLSILFFYLTNWIGQEYFSPQGLNFFIYLVIIAMLLKWFRMPPQPQKHWQSEQNTSFRHKFAMWLTSPDPGSTILQPWQQRGLLCCLILIFGFSVSSHQLTPFFTLTSVGALVIFRRCRPFWLPILMAIMIAFWVFVMAKTYIAGHGGTLLKDLGDFLFNISAGTTQRAEVGDPQHALVVKLRLLMTGLIWCLAFLGCMKRLRQGYQDITYILLALAGFILIAAQSYGGEMFLRIYLFTLPFMVFFAAGLFFGKSTLTRHKQSPHRQSPHRQSRWMAAAIIITSLILLGGFFFTRYGNERVDYITYAEWNGVQHLYQVAPAHSLLLEPGNYVPWQFENYEKYLCESLSSDSDALLQAVLNADVNPIIQRIQRSNASSTYMIFTRSQQAELTAYDDAPDDTLAKLKAALLASGDFRQIYSNPDAQILLYTGISRHRSGS